MDTITNFVASAQAPHETPDAKRAALDDILRSLNAVREIVIGERNALAPINKIPNELLALIFLGVIDPHPSPELMSVCRRWRAVALSAPTLWANLQFMWAFRHARFRKQLELSGDVPLRVRIGDLPGKGVIGKLVENAYRIEKLNVGAMSDQLTTFIPKVLVAYFPILYHLHLEMHLDLRDDDENDADPMEALVLPPEILDGRLPKLRTLTLKGIETQWELLHSLHSLTLHSKETIFANLIAFDVFLSILRACPRLTFLELHLVLAHGARERYSQVQLPHLEQLHIRDHLDILQDLLQFVAFPTTTRIALFPLGIHSGSDVRDMLVPLRKHLRAPGAPTPRSISITAPFNPTTREITNLQVEVSTKHEAIRRYSPSGFDQPLFSINSHPPTAPALRQILPKVLHAIPCEGITYFDASDASLSKASWRVVCGLLPAVDTIDINIGVSGTQMCDALAEMFAEESGRKRRSRAARPFPLKTIELRGFIRDDDEEYAQVPPFMDAFKRMLRGYAGGATRVQRLKGRVIVYRKDAETVLEREWEEIRELVGEVTVHIDDWLKRRRLWDNDA